MNKHIYIGFLLITTTVVVLESAASSQKAAAIIPKTYQPVSGVYVRDHDDPPEYSMSPNNLSPPPAGATGASASVFQAAATITFTGGTQVVAAT